jgi:2'-5' RNA ligase
MPSSVNTGYWDDVSYSGPKAWQSAALDLILEYIPDLHWPQAGDVLNRMRNDGQLAGSLRAYTLPIRRAPWSLDPAGCRPSVVKLVSEDLGLPVLGSQPKASGARRRRVVWSDHLRVALSLNAIFGHAPFEQAYDTSTGQARLATLQERLPKSIFRILVDSFGQIDYVEQNRYAGEPDPPTIQSNALVWYVNDREGLGWRGRSLMRPSYPYWLIKDQMLRVHATSNRRWGMGIPYAKAPPGALPGQIAEAERVIQTTKAREFAGSSLPAGFELGVAGMTGTVPDTLAFIRWLDSQMSVTFLTQWLNLGNTETGARALAEVFVDMFTQSIQDFGDSQADQATRQIVVPLVDINFSDTEPAPKIVCGNVGANHAITATSMAALYTCGALSSDPELENYIRELYKLPLRDPDAPVLRPGIDVPNVETAPAPAVPAPATTVAAAAETGFTGAYVMGMLSPTDAARLAQPDGADPTAMHVTLAFLSEPASSYSQGEREALEEALTSVDTMPVTADAFATATLNADNDPDDDRPPCVVLLVQSSDLAALHDRVTKSITATKGFADGSFPVWVPHVTLGYGLDAADLPTGLLGPLTFARLVVGWGDEQHDLTTPDASAA